MFLFVGFKNNQPMNYELKECSTSYKGLKRGITTWGKIVKLKLARTLLHLVQSELSCFAFLQQNFKCSFIMCLLGLLAWVSWIARAPFWSDRFFYILGSQDCFLEHTKKVSSIRHVPVAIIVSLLLIII